MKKFIQPTKVFLAVLFVFLGVSLSAQNPYIQTNPGDGAGQYGYLEKDATSFFRLNSNAQSNIYQLYARTFLNGNVINTYGSAVNVCGGTTNVVQDTNNYNFGSNAIVGEIAYTSVTADYCLGGGSNSGYNERQQYIFDVTDRPSDLSSSVAQINSGTPNVVMSVKIDFGSVNSRVLQRFFIKNTGSLAEGTDIANDGFKLYYEAATGSEIFDGTESNATIYGDYAGDATTNNIYGSNALNIAIPAGGLRIYVVLNKFNSCITTAKTVQVSLLNDGMNFTPKMDTNFDAARVDQIPAAPIAIPVTFGAAPSGALSGTYFIPSVCFPTVASAVNALNAKGVAGPVVFNVAAGYTETAPAAGFTFLGGGAAGNLATGTSTNTIVFQKSGAGANPTFTAPTQATGYVLDGIFKINGGDFITIDGFTMKENPANTISSPVGSNNMTEFGVAIFYGGTTGATANGATDNIIKNCIISLNKTYTNTFGIYSTTTHSGVNNISTPVSGTAITVAAGKNANNKVYSNDISNVNFGIVMLGTNALEDLNSDIGGTSIATGNSITDQGNTGTSTYSGMPGTSTGGIITQNSLNSNISFNTIVGNPSSNNTYGIFVRLSGAASSATHTTNILNNNIQVSCNAATSSYSLIGISDEQGGANHTININGNKIQNSTTTNTSFGGTFAGIWTVASAKTININGNTISNNTISGSSLPNSPSARSALIKVSSAPTGPVSVSNNIMNANNFTNTGAGDIVAFDVNGNYTGSCTISGNTVDDLKTSGTGSIYGYFNGVSSSPTGALTVSENTFKNVKITGAGSSSTIQFVRSLTIPNNSININGNTVIDLTISAVNSSGISGVYLDKSNSQNIYNNTFKNFAASGSNAGINSIGGGSTALNVYGNTIDNLSSATNTGTPFHFGIQTNASANIYSNKISNINAGSASTNSTVYGIWAFGGTTSNIYNNFVADLKAPSSGSSGGTLMTIQGIRASSTNVNAYNNSIYLKATSTGPNFGSACFALGSTSLGDLRNNIFVNESVASGIQYSAALLNLSNAYSTGTVPANIATATNNNCLYASGLNAAIYKDIENATTTPNNFIGASCFDISKYLAYMTGGRETNSFSEIPPFVSTTPGSMDLHLTSGSTSGTINGGQAIALTSPDIDGTARPIGAGYEIGANEVAGTGADKIPPVISYTAIADVGCASTPASLTATITDAGAIGSGATAPRLYFKKSSDATTTIASANNNSVSGWKFVTATGSGPYTFTFDYTLLPGGLVGGETVQYFVAAQDASGNVATSSATVSPCATTVVFTSAQTVTAPPAINQFTYRGSLSGAYTVGTGSGQTFPTLSGTGGLFDAINKGYVSGDITATVTSNTVETGAVALNEWTEYNTSTCDLTGTGIYRLTVQSDGSVRTLEGTNLVYDATALQAMINLNGADRVTFTGGTTTQRNLVFRSTNTLSSSGIPVFQMGNVNGSNDIIIKNCDIQSNGTYNAGPYFSACIFVTGAGKNANNLFQFNDIHNATAGTAGSPRWGIYAADNSFTVLQIKDNNFYNIFSKAIQLGDFAFGDAQTITGNSFYNTGVGTVNTNYTAIEINAGSGSGHTVSNNFIGGTSAGGGISGSPFANASITTFKGIYFGSNGNTTTSTISNNVIGNLNLLNGSSVAFSGIDFTGKVVCDQNTIGHDSDATKGITIGGVSASGNTSNYGIIGGVGTAVSGIAFTNNKVKFITHNTSGTGASKLFGIYSYYTGAAGVSITISGNIINDLSSSMKGGGNLFASGSALGLASVIGILSGTVASSKINIDANTIFNLKATTTGTGSTNPGVAGIAIDGNTTNTITRNKIYNFTNLSPGSATNPGTIVGIRLQPNTSTVANNMISLSNTNTNASRIIGVWDNANNLTMHYNSIYIGGSQTASGNTGISSAPYLSLQTAGTRNVRNNILQNTRTGGTNAATTLHYSIALPVSSTSLVSDYNDLLAADPNKLCLFNTTSHTITSWRILTTPNKPDVHSQTTAPIFVDLPNGDLHLTDENCALNNSGTPVATTTDIDGDTRSSTTPDIGADEFAAYALAVSPVGLACNTTTANLTTAVTSGIPGNPASLTYWIDPAATTTPVPDPTSVPAGTYYIKYGSCLPIQSVLVSLQSATYSAGAWNVPPDTNKALVFNSDYTATGTDIAGCNCTVNSTAKVTIAGGDTMTLQNEITVNNDATFTVESDGNLIQVKNVPNTGNIIAKRIANIKRLDYVYWTSPVTGQKLKNFSPGTLDSRFFTYNEWDDKFTVMPSSSNFGDNQTGFENAAKGYAIRASNTQPTPATNWLGVFKGVPNNGDVSFPLAYHSGTNPLGSGNGNNLVGNPYPSNINFDQLVDNTLSPGNQSSIHTLAYFWTNTNPNGAMQGSGYPNGLLINNYAIYNGIGGVGATGAVNSADPSQNSPIPDGNIKVGQAFVVKARQSGKNLIFNNKIRTSASGSFFDKSSPVDRYWLQLTTPLNVQSTTLIGYKEAATNDFELDYDAPLLVLGADALFSTLETKKLAIQGRQYPLVTTDIVPLGTSQYEAGNYTISLGNKEGIFANGQNIYLKDKQTSTITNLSENNYIFNANSGVTEGRFEIVYQNDIVLASGNTEKGDLVVYRDGNNFVLKSKKKNISEVELYDTAGRLILKITPNQIETKIDSSTMISGIFILKINRNGEMTSKKIIK